MAFSNNFINIMRIRSYLQANTTATGKTMTNSKDMDFSGMKNALFGNDISMDAALLLVDIVSINFTAKDLPEWFVKKQVSEVIKIGYRANIIRPPVSNEDVEQRLQLAGAMYEKIKGGPNARWYLDELEEFSDNIELIVDLYECTGFRSNSVIDALKTFYGEVSADVEKRKHILTLRPSTGLTPAPGL